MATRARLDVNRTRLVEPAFHLTRHARDMNRGATYNNIYQWPHTRTITLQTLQAVTDFTETASWDSIKFRLSDCDYNADWWTEVPNLTRADVGKADYFFNTIVKAANVPPQFPSQSKFLLLDLLVNVAETAVINAINYEQQHGVSVIRSKNALPANQGYHLRFHVDGRENMRRANIMDFYFGEYILRLNSAGQAQLWQSADFVTYGYVYAWPWALPDQVHGRDHSITIFPHARNKIEFLSSGGGHHWGTYHDSQGSLHLTQFRDTRGGGIYELPEVILDENDVPVITQENKWTLVVSREFRHHIQVSKLSFVNGTLHSGDPITAGTAGFWDNPVDIKNRSGNPFPPKAPISGTVEVDENGGAGTWALRNFQTGEPWASDGTATQVQFGMGLQGIGDIPGPGLGSSITPEFYSYTLDKPARFQAVTRNEVYLPVRTIAIDQGDAPESERMTILLDNSLGQARKWVDRATIPLELMDIDTQGNQLLYFEGNATQTDSSLCSADRPHDVQIEATGLVDQLLRFEWSGVPPNFERDPNDAMSRGWPFGDVIRQCFESAGVPPEEVVIEEERAYFGKSGDPNQLRIWTSPGAAPATGGGHEGGAVISRWQPRVGVPVHEFTDWFIRTILGWNWHRDRRTRTWRIYKRPDPSNAMDVAAGKFVPKVEFYDDAHPRVLTDIPGYKHSRLKKRQRRPVCTTILIHTLWNVSDFPDRQAIKDALQNLKDGTDNPETSLVKVEQKHVILPFTNYHGFPNPKNDPYNGDHPDAMDEPRTKEIKVVQGNTKEALEWIGNRLYQDNCFGHNFYFFEADWGDEFTCYLRKYDVVMVNGSLWQIYQIEPQWDNDVTRRARYIVNGLRTDTLPPR